jgi:hypothetical protein
LITSMSLDRFRGFHSAALELKPLTVLLGANSAGKSSFLQALAALHFIRRLRISPATLCPDGVNSSSWPLDFGNRKILQTDGTLDEGGVRIKVGLRQGLSDTEIAYDFGRKNSEDSLDLSGVEIYEKPMSVVTAGAIQAGTTVTLQAPTAIEAVEGQSEHPQTGKIAVREVGDGFWQEPDGAAIVVAINNLQLEYYGRRTGTLVTVSSPGQKHLLEVLEQVRYLRPSRCEPRRKNLLRPPTLPDDDVGPNGEWAGETWISHRHKTQVEFRVPPPARINRDEAAKLLDNPKGPSETVAFDVAVDRWLHHLGVAQRARAEETGEGVSLRVDVSGRDRGLPDVGFGVSQILPVLVQGLALPEGGTLLVEQPEAQLHPRPQAQLADFFCSLVERRRNCIVETHSEAFFRRLQLRTLLDPDLASQVAVYFFDPVNADGCCQPVLIPLDIEGAMPWPKEFLAEGIRAHAAFAAVRTAIAQRGPGSSQTT